MKLNWEDSDGNKVEIVNPCDELTIEEMKEEIRRLLLAIGYHPNNINEVFDGE